jgi:hypothetical protein
MSPLCLARKGSLSTFPEIGGGKRSVQRSDFPPPISGEVSKTSVSEFETEGAA